MLHNVEYLDQSTLLTLKTQREEQLTTLSDEHSE